MQIALAADMVIASDDALFTHPAFRYLGAGPQDMWAWVENLGIKKMKEIMFKTAREEKQVTYESTWC